MEAASHGEQIERPSLSSECSPLLSEQFSNASSLPPPQHDDPAACDSSAKKVQQLILDGKGSNWHQSPIFAPQDKERKPEDALPIMDFDLLCATIAMQREPLSVDVQRDACEVGVQRMWEGGVLDCFEDKEIALRTFCCPSVTYGKNLSRAGFGSCIAKGGVHFLLLVTAFISYILFLCAYGRQYLYTAITVLICVAVYASFYRIQIRRKFNIKGSDLDGVVSAFDDGLNHFICGCCALCQEARTLEMNNVQDGSWRGRGDTLWVGSYAMPTASQGIESSEQDSDLRQPVVVTISPEDSRESDGHS
ncbi:hypothetical protein GOP47_0030445 [Adiantum capillus-veneris]|nr:hypothetical protein GOP47_0030100 [Adiantum capillus-veneris]KAI5055300.1 hypothetical protein GOP47_0030445 [Adiantum capillus-veneris]